MSVLRLDFNSLTWISLCFLCPQLITSLPEQTQCDWHLWLCTSQPLCCSPAILQPLSQI